MVLNHCFDQTHTVINIASAGNSEVGCQQQSHGDIGKERRRSEVQIRISAQHASNHQNVYGVHVVQKIVKSSTNWVYLS